MVFFEVIPDDIIDTPFTLTSVLPEPAANHWRGIVQYNSLDFSCHVPIAFKTHFSVANPVV